MNYFSKEIDGNSAKKGSETNANKLLEEANARFKEFQELELKFEKKLDEYYEAIGSSAKNEREKPRTPEQIAEIQKMKDKLLAPWLKKAKTKSLDKLAEVKQDSDDKKSRKARSKLRGFKQNWISVK